ncbi:10334_t:CDS:2 [Funneliformis geosporum]|nr:10334_t:CDS:2 [Funneliformis geosporum]
MIAHERYRNDNSFHVEYPNYENIHYFTSEKTLSGILSLTRFFNLERLVIKDQEIDKLNLTQCSNLKELHARDNLIKTIILPNETSKLEMLDLTNNNILDHDLFYITNYTNLTYLHLGTDNVAKLNINATDINDGLAYLPTDNLYYFTCGSMGRVNAGVEQIKEMLDLDEETAVSEDTDEN